MSRYKIIEDNWIKIKGVPSSNLCIPRGVSKLTPNRTSNIEVLSICEITVDANIAKLTHVSTIATS